MNTSFFAGPRCNRIFNWHGDVHYTSSLQYVDYVPFVQPGFPVGSTVTISCDSGYKKSGPEQSVCQSNGEWTQLATCKSN